MTAGEEPIVPGQSWHVIRTVSNREHSVAKHLQNEGLTAFCPMVTVTSIRRGRRVERRQALFRNYAFGYWSGENARQWHAVNDTRHVLGIIGGEHPSPVAHGIIEGWQDCAGDGATDAQISVTVADIRRGYKVGGQVRLQRGRDDAMVGIVVWVDDRQQRVGIRVELLGRQPIVVRNQRDVEAVDAPLPNEGVRRRRRGGKRGTKARQRAFVNYVASALATTAP